RNVVDRVIDYKERIMRFLTYLTFPIENNQAERDLKMMKLQQKISGTLRPTRRAEASAELELTFLQ
ncbi:MAG: transposase, partial [Euryarchaeota archaeon]|nr:transposase [Euryarchaeota archaeon]